MDSKNEQTSRAAGCINVDGNSLADYINNKTYTCDPLQATVDQLNKLYGSASMTFVSANAGSIVRRPILNNDTREPITLPLPQSACVNVVTQPNADFSKLPTKLAEIFGVVPVTLPVTAGQTPNNQQAPQTQTQTQTQTPTPTPTQTPTPAATQTPQTLPQFTVPTNVQITPPPGAATTGTPAQQTVPTGQTPQTAVPTVTPAGQQAPQVSPETTCSPDPFSALGLFYDYLTKTRASLGSTTKYSSFDVQSIAIFLNTYAGILEKAGTGLPKPQEKKTTNNKIEYGFNLFGAGDKPEFKKGGASATPLDADVSIYIGLLVGVIDDLKKAICDKVKTQQTQQVGVPTTAPSIGQPGTTITAGTPQTPAGGGLAIPTNAPSYGQPTPQPSAQSPTQTNPFITLPNFQVSQSIDRIQQGLVSFLKQQQQKYGPINEIWDQGPSSIGSTGQKALTVLSLTIGADGVIKENVPSITASTLPGGEFTNMLIALAKATMTIRNQIATANPGKLGNDFPQYLAKLNDLIKMLDTPGVDLNVAGQLLQAILKDAGLFYTYENTIDGRKIQASATYIIKTGGSPSDTEAQKNPKDIAILKYIIVLVQVDLSVMNTISTLYPIFTGINPGSFSFQTGATTSPVAGGQSSYNYSFSQTTNQTSGSSNPFNPY